MGKSRPCAVAGTFYPEDPDELREQVSLFIDTARPPSLRGRLKGIIVPHAGLIYSGPIAAYGYRAMKDTDVPSRIILLGPSHYASFRGIASSGYSSFDCPLGQVPLFDIGNSGPLMNEYPRAHESEHSLEVQLPFLYEAMGARPFEAAPLLCGEIPPGQGADLIEEALGDSFLIVSSDLSHYLPYEEAKRVDQGTISAIEALDIEGMISSGDACGKAAILIAMEMARRKGYRISLLKYANSGDTAGPKTQVVGYAALAISQVD